MIKDIEQIIGRPIKGLTNSDISTINIESCIDSFMMNKHQLKSDWQYDSESNVLTVKNGNFNASILFEVFTLVRIAKLWPKYKKNELPVIKKVVKTKVLKPIKKAAKVKKPATKVIILQAARYTERKAS